MVNLTKLKNWGVGFKSLLGIIFVTVYWIYLLLQAQPSITMDALGYVDLAEKLIQNNFNYFLFDDLKREPIYIYFIAFNIQFAEVFQIDYLFLVKLTQFLILGFSVFLLNKCLKILDIQRNIRRGCCFLFALSPALINSALSVFSEIITYPFALGLMIIFLRLPKLSSQRRLFSLKGILLLFSFIICLSGLTFTKAIFEPVLLVSCILMAGLAWLIKNVRSVALPINIFLISGLIIFSGMTYIYKIYNFKYYGVQSFTNRGDWALFGNTKRRAQPIELKDFVAAAATIPGWGVCQKFFTKKECDFWKHWQSDRYSFEESAKLKNLNLTKEEKKEHYMSETKKYIAAKPIQFSVLVIMEGLKMFFWESTQIGFVNYPDSLTAFFQNTIVRYSYRLVFSLISLISFFMILFVLIKGKMSSPYSFALMGIWIVLFFLIGAHSLFFVLSRYVFPVASFYFIFTAFLLNRFSRIQPKQ